MHRDPLAQPYKSAEGAFVSLLLISLELAEFGRPRLHSSRRSQICNLGCPAQRILALAAGMLLM